MDNEILKSLNAIMEKISLHEQETVAINFSLGDLLNRFAECSAKSTNGASIEMERHSGIHHALFLNYARIARRIAMNQRPQKVPWGAVKYITSDLNPTRFGVNESDFAIAAVRALKEVEKRKLMLVDLKLVDLKLVDSDGWTVGEKIVKKHL